MRRVEARSPVRAGAHEAKERSVNQSLNPSREKRKFVAEEQMDLNLVTPESPEKPWMLVKGRGAARFVERRKSGPPILKAIRKETGIGLKAIKRAEKLHPGDPLSQVVEFFETFVIPAATGRRRTVSIKTEELYVVQMRVMVGDLSRLNMSLRNLSEIGPRHVAALTRHYEVEGLSSSSLQKKNTVLRRFGTWLGKPDMTPRLSDLVLDPARAKRSYSAVESKAWSAHGVDTAQVIATLDGFCPVAGLQMRIQRAFGLRTREVVSLKPQQADLGQNLFVTDGTKGGRPRMVPIDTIEKRDLIERAKVIASSNKRGILSDRPSRPLHTSINHYYYLCRKAGVSQSGLGVTLHGLRHEFANNVFREITGVDAPVNGGRIDDPELVRRAMQVTSNQLGHGRKDAGAAYLGSKRHLDHVAFKNLQNLTHRIEGDPRVQAAAQEAGPATWWVIGQAAEGKALKGTLRLAYQIDADTTDAQVQLQSDLAAAVAAMKLALAAGEAMGCTGSIVPASSLKDPGIERFELIGLDQKGKR